MEHPRDVHAGLAPRVAEFEKLATIDNLDACIARAHAESNKAGSGECFYAWNRVLHALWDVRMRLPKPEKT